MIPMQFHIPTPPQPMPKRPPSGNGVIDQILGMGAGGAKPGASGQGQMGIMQLIGSLFGMPF